MVLQTVISQQLLPSVDGKLIPVFEIMHTNAAIKNLIREGKTHQIDSAIQSGAAQGMISMDASLLKLAQQGRITKDTALDVYKRQVKCQVDDLFLFGRIFRHDFQGRGQVVVGTSHGSGSDESGPETSQCAKACRRQKPVEPAESAFVFQMNRRLFIDLYAV